MHLMLNRLLELLAERLLHIGLHLLYLLLEIVLVLCLLIEELTAPIFKTLKLFNRVLVIVAAARLGSRRGRS